MVTGCGSGLAASTSFYLTDGNTPWETKMKQNVLIGWGEIDFCYKCIGTNYNVASTFYS